MPVKNGKICPRSMVWNTQLPLIISPLAVLEIFLLLFGEFAASAVNGRCIFQHFSSKNFLLTSLPFSAIVASDAGAVGCVSAPLFSVAAVGPDSAFFSFLNANAVPSRITILCISQCFLLVSLTTTDIFPRTPFTTIHQRRSALLGSGVHKKCLLDRGRVTALSVFWDSSNGTLWAGGGFYGL